MKGVSEGHVGNAREDLEGGRWGSTYMVAVVVAVALTVAVRLLVTVGVMVTVLEAGF